MEAKSEPHGVDESLYSRQLYVYGAAAQRKMQESNVLLVGLKGLGVEIAKNIILSGVKSVGIVDPEPVKISDLGSQFYLRAGDVGKPRAECSVPLLKELNKYVDVHHVPVKGGCQLPYLDESVLKKYNCVCLTGKTITEQKYVNKMCRKLGIKFIAADVHGLLGSIFCDFIEITVNDTDGERERRGLVTNITNEEKAVVTTEKNHQLGTGDYVVFREVGGMTKINDLKVKVKNLRKDKFELDLDTREFKQYTNSGSFQQVKIPVTFKFQSLEEQLEAPKIAWTDFVLEEASHCLRVGISSFEEKHKRLPDPTNIAEAKQVVEFAVEYGKSVKLPLGEKKTRSIELDTKVQEKLVKLASAACAQITPMTATMGGLVGQEIIKGCMAKFTPLRQFMYFNALQALPTEPIGKHHAPKGTRYDDYYAVFGNKVQEKIFDLNMFLIGSGAIGCEMLKNWAMMGLSTGSGKITITDMDSIEKSNLSRQFLFRPKDIGKMKAECATAAAKVMNPKMQIKTDDICVGKASENVYDDAFWESLYGACTALDNMKARLYIDQRCVEFQKPLVDSGTLGTKGNTQVCVPFLTESYGESRDPPEEGIPVCTVKLYPYRIEHTIQWARELFEGFFVSGASDSKSFVEKKGYLQEAAEDQNSYLGVLKTLNEMLVEHKPKNFEDCVTWARLKFEKHFHNDIIQLTTIHPKAKADKKGNPFWSGKRRYPIPTKFDSKRQSDYDFIYAASNMYASIFNIPICKDEKVIRAVADKVKVPEFKPDTSMKIAEDDEDQKAEEKKKKEAKVEGLEEIMKRLEDALPKPADIRSEVKLSPAKFEKDDPTNFHIDFITAASNARAYNYSIAQESKHQTKFIAGKIIPAIATTTAMVTGLVCLEWYKLIQNKDIEAYRNSYANLALPSLTPSEPMTVSKREVKLAGDKKGESLKFSCWDHIKVEMDEGTSLKDFLKYWYKTYGLKVGALTYGPTSLYMSAMKKGPGMKKVLKMPLAKVAEQKSGEKLPDTPYLKLSIVCDNPEADEKSSDEDKNVQFPPVRFYYKK
mmetsp:Transcript_18112/g.27166  ORF Transcript_18112/g.27166 Transcript_18112/m.27166 type:complete len:1043 (-) Transcript_18112:182-3310(-)